MVTFESDGSLTFRVYLPHAASVELVADFTQWAEARVALQREDGPRERRTIGERGLREAPSHRADAAGGGACGWWSLQVSAPEGDHAFSYLVDNTWWLPDYAAHGVKRNEHGNWTSLLFVPPPPRLVERMGRRRLGHDEPRRSRLEAALRDQAAGLREAV